MLKNLLNKIRVSSKKYLSSIQSPVLSKHLGSDVGDWVFETHFKKNNKNESGIVGFNKCRGWCSVMAIEMCKAEDVTDLLIIARGLMEKHSLLAFFLYDHENAIGYEIKKGPWGYETSSKSFYKRG